MEEFEELADAGSWTGGYVTDDAGNVVYMMKELIATGSGSGSGSGKGCGSLFEFASGSYTYQYEDEDDDNDDGGDGEGWTDNGNHNCNPGDTTIGGGGHHGNSDDSSIISQSKLMQLLKGAGYISSEFYERLLDLEKKGIIVRTKSTEEHPIAYYNMDSGRLYITPQSSERGIIHEMIHYHQNQLKTLDYETNSSNNEYQAYLLTYILHYCKGDYCNPEMFGFSDETMNQLDSLMYRYVQQESDGYLKIGNPIVDFLYNLQIEESVNAFVNYAQTHNFPEYYSRGYVKDYNWNWLDFFQWFGVRIE